MLSEVLYVSQSTHRCGHASDLGILNSAQRNNSRNRLTGILLRGEDWFAQCLEGPQAELRSTFERIAEDDRHFDIRYWWNDELRARRYPRWRMALVDLAGVEHDIQPILVADEVDLTSKHARIREIMDRYPT